MVLVLAFVFLFLLTVGGLIYSLRRRSKTQAVLRYEEKPLFGKGESVLFGRLCRALPNCYIFPQVTLSCLLEPVESDQKRNSRYADEITTQRIDYAVCDGNLELVCVVLLAPDSDKHRLMERCLDSAGIKVIRWSTDTKPSVEQISRSITPLISSTKPGIRSENVLNPDTLQRMYTADPVPSNIRGLNIEQLDKLTPNKVLSGTYPHIWQRICLFAPEPKHLQKYLLSLSIQDRGEKRAGFPIEALKEIADIQTENERFLLQPVTGWQKSFINR